MREKSGAFLNFIIGYKALMGVIELILSFSFFKYLDRDLASVVTRLAISMNLDADNYFLKALIKQAGLIGSSTFAGITVVILVFGILNIIEAYGLYRRFKWAEWLTVIATGLLIPVEVYAVAVRLTLAKVVVLVINSAIVYYLARHKNIVKGKARKRAPAKA